MEVAEANITDNSQIPSTSSKESPMPNGSSSLQMSTVGTDFSNSVKNDILSDLPVQTQTLVKEITDDAKELNVVETNLEKDIKSNNITETNENVQTVKDKEKEVDEGLDKIAKDIKNDLTANPSKFNKIKERARAMINSIGETKFVYNWSMPSTKIIPYSLKKRLERNITPILQQTDTTTLTPLQLQMFNKINQFVKNMKTDIASYEARVPYFSDTYKTAVTDRIKGFFKWRGGTKLNRKRLNQKSKKNKKQQGGDGEEFFGVVGFVCLLIACCMTVIGCVVCGPLLLGIIYLYFFQNSTPSTTSAEFSRSPAPNGSGSLHSSKLSQTKKTQPNNKNNKIGGKNSTQMKKTKYKKWIKNKSKKIAYRMR